MHFDGIKSAPNGVVRLTPLHPRAPPAIIFRGACNSTAFVDSPLLHSIYHKAEHYSLQPYERKVQATW